MRLGRGVGRAGLFALPTLFVACGLDVVGEAPLGTATPDAVAPGSDGAPTGSGDALDEPDAFVEGKDSSADADAEATPDADAGPDANPPTDAGCPPLATVPTGTTARTAVIARAANAAGTAATHVFRDCPTLVVDSTTAAFKSGSPKAKTTVYLEWEPSALWVRFDVADAQIVGTDPTPYLNDSIEFYASSDPNRAKAYDVHDHQFIVDHRGVGLHDTNGTETGYTEGVATAIPGGYRVTLKLASSLFGNGNFANGQTLFVDALVNDGTNQDDFFIWSQEPHAGAATNYPASDARLFSPATLE